MLTDPSCDWLERMKRQQRIEAINHFQSHTLDSTGANMLRHTVPWKEKETKAECCLKKTSS